MDTCRRSFSVSNCASPRGSAELRSGPGPAPTPRIREKLVQGVPMWTPQTRPDLIQPTISRTAEGLHRS